MTQIFEQGHFRNSRISDSTLKNLNESRTFSSERILSNKTTVFLSHKHDELDDLKDFIGFLQKNYNVDVYIDSIDPNMPKNTSGETAKRIKNIIKKCDRFILIATDAAIESKWCNWELGYGDAQKYRDRIAILPIKKQGNDDSQYKGNEYLYIYPYIAYYDGSETYKNGNYVDKGYYVVTQGTSRSRRIELLANWLKKIKL
jgi:hypothetical protein